MNFYKYRLLINHFIFGNCSESNAAHGDRHTRVGFATQDASPQVLRPE